MGEIVPLSSEPHGPSEARADVEPDEYHEGDGPHLRGEAFCGACKHEWYAVVPVDAACHQHFECPDCHRMWGTMKHVFVPETVWTCNCGEQLFWLTPTGASCRRCGMLATGWE